MSTVTTEKTTVMQILPSKSLEVQKMNLHQKKWVNHTAIKFNMSIVSTENTLMNQKYKN